MSQIAFILLLACATAAHLADRLTLDTVTLAASVAGLTPPMIGLLVAAQSAAWLLVSLPAGVLADRLSPRQMIGAGGLCILLGSLAGAGLVLGKAPALLLGLATFLAATGTVLVALSLFVIVPRIVATAELATANGRLELGRAIVTLAAPIIAGWLVGKGAASSALLLAAFSGLVIVLAARQLPRIEASTAPRQSMLSAIATGGRFVVSHPWLRPIALCAIFWNLAFFGLMAILAPYAQKIFALGPEQIGTALSAYGAGLLTGASLGPAIIARLRIGWLLVFGPASSLLAALCLALAPASTGWIAIALASFLFGFGPILWFIVQTSLRQAVTPPELLGRVSATITTAIYGMRPLGALGAGLVAGQFGLEFAIWMPVVLFALSTAAILASQMPALRTMPERAAIA